MSNDLRELRIFRFQFFFHVASSSTELLIKKEELKDDLNNFSQGESFALNSNQKDSILRFCEGTIDQYSELIDLVSKYSNKWKVERFSKVDLSLIIMAFYELKFMSTPYKVVINESVELAKSFGTKESPQFVNGILDRFYKEEIKK